MPNFIGPLLPSFGFSDETKKGLKKIELLAVSYALAVTVAKAVPATAKPIGFLTGLELAAGQGVKVKLGFFLVTPLPQPIGVAPPHLYGLPDVMGDPIALYKIARGPDSRDALARRMVSDEIKVDQKRAAEVVFDRQTQPQFTRDFSDAIIAGDSPRAPSLGDVVGVPGLSFSDVPSLLTGGRLPGADSPDQTVADLSSYAAVLARAAAGVLDRTGSIPVVQPGQPTTGTAAIVGQVQRLDQFGRLNPPDP